MNSTRPTLGSAAKFYRTVFDWDVVDFSVGDSAYKFFKLDGYGASLAKNNPEFAERIAADESAAALPMSLRR